MKYSDYKNVPMFGSHYDYLKDHLKPFWNRVFENDFDPRGMISAHGDKAYGYKEYWEEHGIDFGRGMLLFLLTYAVLSYDETHTSKEWVVENYGKYKNIIEEVEEEVTEEKAEAYNRILMQHERLLEYERKMMEMEDDET